MENTSLVKRAQSGDRQALARLLQQNYEIVFGYLLKVTLNRATAEDLVQDTMVRAIEKIRSYNGRARFSTWLITIATNLYRDQLRRNKVAERSLEVLDLPVSDEGDPKVELKANVREALGKLTPEKRITLILRYVYDYSYDEIAAAVGVPVGTVRSRLHNGIADLREILVEPLP